MDDRDRKAHWRRTTTLAVLVLGLMSLLVFVIWARVEQLNQIVVFGFPVGFYLVAQGLVILSVIMAFWFTVRQESLDRKFGVEDD